jgi:hypothetical protein
MPPKTEKQFGMNFTLKLSSTSILLKTLDARFPLSTEAKISQMEKLWMTPVLLSSPGTTTQLIPSLTK